MPEKQPTPQQMMQIDTNPPQRDWMDPRIDFEERKGTYCYSAKPDMLRYLGMPNPRKWQPWDKDWKLPENWKEIILQGMKDRLEKFRSFQLFMDICVRCGACADTCHFFAGSGDPKNMPVMRAELMRSVYRRYFTTAGTIFGKQVGALSLIHISEPTRLGMISYAVFCLKKKK